MYSRRPSQRAVRRAPMEPPCPHCDQPDLSLLRLVLIFQQAALARPKGVQPVVSNHRLSAAFSFSRRLSPPKPFEPTSFQVVGVQFPRGGFSPPEGRLARGCKPPAFSRFLFQSAVQSAESFCTRQLLAGAATRGRKANCLASCIDQTWCSINSILRGTA